MMTFTFPNEVLSPFWSSMLTLPRYEMLNATGISNCLSPGQDLVIPSKLDICRSYVIQ